MTHSKDRDGWHAEYAKGTGRHRICMDWMCDVPGPHYTYGHSPEVDNGGAFWPLEWQLVAEAAARHMEGSGSVTQSFPVYEHGDVPDDVMGIYIISHDEGHRWRYEVCFEFDGEICSDSLDEAMTFAAEYAGRVAPSTEPEFVTGDSVEVVTEDNSTYPGRIWVIPQPGGWGATTDGEMARCVFNGQEYVKTSTAECRSVADARSLVARALDVCEDRYIGDLLQEALRVMDGRSVDKEDQD